MQDYTTRAIVLQKEVRHDADARYSFFTERYGKVAARAKSARKIVSKLAGHLEPGTLVDIRLIEIHGAQVVDALKVKKMDMKLADLGVLNELLGEWEPEMRLWRDLVEGQFFWPSILAILGWDPRGASCANCGTSPAWSFYLPRQEFYCARCASNFRRNEILLI